MPAPIHVVLNTEEDRTLTELRLAQSVPQRTRDRAHMIRLNAQGWRVPAIAEIFECHEQTVRVTLRRWQDNGLGGLWEAMGRGAKRQWQEADMRSVEEWVEQDPRTYNSYQLAEKLVKERQVKLSARRIRHLLQKRASAGNALATPIEGNKTLNKNGLNRLSWIR